MKTSYRFISSLASITLCIALAGGALASDHRESPLIQGDPQADITDLYAFLNPRDKSKLVLVLNVSPFQVTVQEGAYHFSPGVRYRFNIDSDGDGRADKVIDLRFTPFNVTTHVQRFRARLPHGIAIDGTVTEGTRLTPFPNEPVIAEGPNGIRIFAGPRDDPFFVDTVGVIRTFAGTGRFSGTDALKGYNISSIVVEVPLALVNDGQAKLGLWAETDRQDTFYNTKVSERGEHEDSFVEYFGPFHQVQRAGNPAIKVIFIPDELKDLYNATQPHEDPQRFAPVLRVAMHQPRFTGLTDAEIERLIGIFTPDTLKLDVTQPVKYPNGRWLADDAVDLIFSSILNVGIPVFFAPGQLDGASNNDVPFSDYFPYLAPPHQAP